MLFMTALSIVDELPLPLPAVGFLALADFLLRHVQSAPTPSNTSTALCALAGLVVQVETNFRVYHFQTLFKAFFKEVISKRSTLNSNGRAATYAVLKGLIIINPKYALDFFEDGVLEAALEVLSDPMQLGEFAKWAEGDEEEFAALLGFLATLLVFGDDVDCALYFRGLYDHSDIENNRQTRIRPMRLLPPQPHELPAAFEAAVEFCAVLYGSHLIDDANEPSSIRKYFTEDHVEYVDFVDTAMRSVLALLELYEGGSIVKACNIIVLLSRHSKGILGLDCHGPISEPTTSSGHPQIAASLECTHRLTLTDIIASCRGLLVEYLLDDLYNFDLDYACVIDAMAVLSGWTFNYWDPLTSNRKSLTVLNDAEVSDAVSAIVQVARDSDSHCERRLSFAVGTSIDMVSPDVLPDNEDEAYSTQDPEILNMIDIEKKKRKSEQSTLPRFDDSLNTATTHSQSGADNALDVLQDVLCDVADMATQLTNAYGGIEDSGSGSSLPEGMQDRRLSYLSDAGNVTPATDRERAGSKNDSRHNNRTESSDTGLSSGIPFERQVSKLVTETSSRSLMEKVLESKDVLDDWEMESTESLCRHMLLLLSVSRCVSCSWLLKFFKRNTLLEIIAELLTDERHGLNTYPLMEEKFIQFFADLCCADPANDVEPSIAVYEHIVNILGSWDNLKLENLIETCILALIVLATTNKTVQRRAVAALEKINVAIWRIGKIRLLEPSLALVAVLGMHRPSYYVCSSPNACCSQVNILIDWMRRRNS